MLPDVTALVETIRTHVAEARQYMHLVKTSPVLDTMFTALLPALDTLVLAVSTLDARVDSLEMAAMEPDQPDQPE